MVWIPETSDPVLVMAAARVEMMEEVNKRMQKLVERVARLLRDSPKAKHLKIETRVLEGSPKDVILNEANRWQADLILLGCHGYGNVKRFLLGSVSQAVALHAPCSVQIVRTKHE
jgi:nucleotide-binding universal stress UspA family protein